MRYFPAAVLTVVAILHSTAHATTLPTPEDSLTTATISAVKPWPFPKAGEAPMVKEQAFIEKLTREHGSDLLVVNFWATNCAPCVAEMPYFTKVSNEYPTARVRIVGLSADLKRDHEKAVLPFLKDRKIPYANYHLFLDQETLITWFSEKWSGELPATFFYDKSGKKVGEIVREVSYEELRKTIEALLLKPEKK